MGRRRFVRFGVVLLDFLVEAHEIHASVATLDVMGMS
jgi:hypothetical protein